MSNRQRVDRIEGQLREPAGRRACPACSADGEALGAAEAGVEAGEDCSDLLIPVPYGTTDEEIEALLPPQCEACGRPRVTVVVEQVVGAPGGELAGRRQAQALPGPGQAHARNCKGRRASKKPTPTRRPVSPRPQAGRPPARRGKPRGSR